MATYGSTDCAKPSSYDDDDGDETESSLLKSTLSGFMAKTNTIFSPSNHQDREKANPKAQAIDDTTNHNNETKNPQPEITEDSCPASMYAMAVTRVYMKKENESATQVHPPRDQTRVIMRSC